MTQSSTLENSAILRVSGVFSSVASAMSCEILPTSVPSPIATTTPAPVPYVTSDEPYAMANRSPRALSRATRGGVLLDGDRLAGQRRLVDAQLALAHEAQVGGDLVAGLQQDEVAGDDLGRRQAQRVAARARRSPRSSSTAASASMAATALASWT